MWSTIRYFTYLNQSKLKRQTRLFINKTDFQLELFPRWEQLLLFFKNFHWSAEESFTDGTQRWDIDVSPGATARGLTGGDADWLFRALWLLLLWEQAGSENYSKPTCWVTAATRCWKRCRRAECTDSVSRVSRVQEARVFTAVNASDETFSELKREREFRGKYYLQLTKQRSLPSEI